MKDSKDKDLFSSIFENLREESLDGEDEDSFLSENYLTEEIDHEILKHRDAHFAGDFKVMHDYYQEERMQQHPEIELERIEYLAQVEAELNQNLTELFLSQQEKEEIANALHAYGALKEIYLDEKKGDLFSRLLADLILAEDEEATEEIEQVVAQGSKIVPALISLLESKEAYNSLFPGYGYAPYFAILCLGKIKDPAAIRPLFEALSQEALFDEQVILEALKNIGEPAKKYLLRQIASHPITKENINAAYALTLFTNDSEVAKIAFEALQDPSVCASTLFSTYLIFNLEALKHTPLKEEVIIWSKAAPLSPSLHKELQEIVADWH